MFGGSIISGYIRPSETFVPIDQRNKNMGGYVEIIRLMTIFTMQVNNRRGIVGLLDRHTPLGHFKFSNTVPIIIIINTNISTQISFPQATTQGMEDVGNPLQGFSVARIAFAKGENLVNEGSHVLCWTSHRATANDRRQFLRDSHG